jgi:hypothetical protein
MPGWFSSRAFFYSVPENYVCEQLRLLHICLACFPLLCIIGSILKMPGSTHERPIAEGRPDVHDLKQAKEFGQKVLVGFNRRIEQSRLTLNQ